MRVVGAARGMSAVGLMGCHCRNSDMGMLSKF